MLHRRKIREMLKCVKYSMVTVNIKQYSTFVKATGLREDRMFSMKTPTSYEETTCQLPG